MEPIAIEWGIPADKFWTMTFDEIVKQVEANKKRYELEMKNRAMFDYNSAQLNAYAFNEPSKMPSAEKIYPFLLTEEEHEKLKPLYLQEYDEDEDFENLMKNFVGIEKHLNKNGGGENSD